MKQNGHKIPYFSCCSKLKFVAVLGPFMTQILKHCVKTASTILLCSFEPEKMMTIIFFNFYHFLGPFLAQILKILILFVCCFNLFFTKWKKMDRKMKKCVFWPVFHFSVHFFFIGLAVISLFGWNSAPKMRILPQNDIKFHNSGTKHRVKMDSTIF